MALAALALSYLRYGEPERAEAIRERLRRRTAERWVAPTVFLAMADLAGDEGAIEAELDRAFTTRDPQFLFYRLLGLGRDPDPRVDRVLESIGMGPLPSP